LLQNKITQDDNNNNQNINNEKVKTNKPMVEQNQNEEVPLPEVKMEKKNEINNYIKEGNKSKLLTSENQIENNGENKDGDKANNIIT
jgi:hypothetical protein